MRSELVVGLAAAAATAAFAPGVARADADADVGDAPAVATGDLDDRGFILGFELGAAGTLGASGAAFAPGFGKALILGYRVGRVALEWHFAQSFGTQPSDERLRGDRTAAELGMSSFSLRYLLFGPFPLVWAVGGVGQVRVPLLSPSTTDEFGVVSLPATFELVGLGAVVGGAAGVPVSGGGIATIEVRGYVPLLWDLPRTYAEPTGDGAAGGVAYTPSTDDAQGVAWSLTFGLRLAL